jgi:hypothetical protein
MNLKFWGGWFLAIACVCIFLTMGCENGSLGVKYATVYGRLVNKDNIAMGVPNATVRMLSKETVSGGGALEQGYNFLATVTDADGYFVFEKVHPDNVIFEFTAPGYRKMVYPATETDTEEADGSTGESADIESVTISNGASVNLANILMTKVSVALPSEINVRMEFIDSTTKKRIDDNEFFTVSFDGIKHKDRAKAWRENGFNITGANEIAVNVRHEGEPVLYNPALTTISGTNDQYISVEVTPVTYSLDFQFLNVPNYILSSEKNKPIITLLVEDSSTTPAQSISITDVESLTQLSLLDIQAVRNPQQIRIRMNGYRDEVISLTSDLIPGEKGSYRLDIDFQLEDGRSGDDPVTAAELNGKVGMLDNVIRSDIRVNMIGLAPNDKANIVTNFIPETITWSQSFVTANNETIGLADAQGAITAILKNSPSYFDMTYSISVFPDNPASSSYIINSGNNAVPIGIPESGSTGTAVSIDVSKISASSTSTTE